MIPRFDLQKIKFGTDSATYQKAVDLYEGGKVTKFEEGMACYIAVVLGSKPYRVVVENRRYDYGDCECYLGQHEELCKHMVAVAIYAVLRGEKIPADDKKVSSEPKCSGQLGELSKEELTKVNALISGALKYIKSYRGPSKTWFAYQNSLSEGCNRLSDVVSRFPVSRQTATVLVKLFLRLDTKLLDGVDDSDGVVGGFMTELVELLKEYAKLDKTCIKTFKPLASKEASFGIEDPLVKIFDESR